MKYDSIRNIIKIGIAIIVIVTLISCATDNYNNSFDNDEAIKTETEIQNKIKQKTLNCVIQDTLLFENNHYVVLSTNKNDKYQLKWGNLNFSKIYPSLFSCWINSDNDTCNFLPRIETFTNDYTILKVPFSTSNATNCSSIIEWKMIYLPTNGKKNTFELENYLKVQDEYILYSNGLDTINVMNINTEKLSSYQLKPKPYIEFKTIERSIGDIKIRNDNLVIKYLVGNHEKYDYIEKELQLKN